MSHHLLNSFKIQIKNMEITSSERLTLKLTSRRWTKKEWIIRLLSVMKVMTDKKEKTTLVYVRHLGDDGQKKRGSPDFCPS